MLCTVAVSSLQFDVRGNKHRVAPILPHDQLDVRAVDLVAGADGAGAEQRHDVLQRRERLRLAYNNVAPLNTACTVVTRS